MKGTKRKMRGRNNAPQPVSQFQVNGQTFRSDFEAALFIILKSNNLTLGKFLEQAIEEHTELQRHHWKLALLQDETFLNGRISKVEHLLLQEFNEDENNENQSPHKRLRPDDGCSSLEDSDEDEKDIDAKSTQAPTPIRSVSANGVSTEGFSGSESSRLPNKTLIAKRQQTQTAPLNESQNASVTTAGAIVTSPVVRSASPGQNNKPVVNSSNQSSSGGSPGLVVSKNFQIATQDAPEIISISPINSVEASPNERDHLVKAPKLDSPSSVAKTSENVVESTNPNNAVPGISNANRKLIQVNSASLPTELLKQCEILFSHVQQHMPELENVMKCAHCTVPPREILMEDRTLLMCYNKQCKLSNKPQLNRVVGWKLGSQP